MEQGKDNILRKCMETYGEGNWHLVPLRAGKSLSMYLFNRLKRCRKSCRLRWLNYVSPNIKRGGFSTDEDDLIIRMQRLLGNRWSLIAGRMLGRTANDIKNYWSSHLAKRVSGSQPAARTDLQPAATPTARTVVYKPQAHRVSPRTCELLRHMYPASAYSFNPPSTSHPPDGIHVAAEQPAVAPEPSSFNLPSQPGEEEFALRGGGGDWFLDAQLDDGLHFGDSFLWDWTKDGDGSLPLC